MARAVRRVGPGDPRQRPHRRRRPARDAVRRPRLDPQPRADRRDRRLHGDDRLAHAAAGAAHDLRPQRLLAAAADDRLRPRPRDRGALALAALRPAGRQAPGPRPARLLGAARGLLPRPAHLQVRLQHQLVLPRRSRESVQGFEVLEDRTSPRASSTRRRCSSSAPTARRSSRARHPEGRSRSSARRGRRRRGDRRAQTSEDGSTARAAIVFDEDPYCAEDARPDPGDPRRARRGPARGRRGEARRRDARSSTTTRRRRRRTWSCWRRSSCSSSS